MLREIVMDSNEFDSLVEGQVRIRIREDPIYMSNMAGTGRMVAATRLLRVVASGISKAKDPQRIIEMHIGSWEGNPFDKEEYQALKDRILEAAKKQFPGAKLGGFE